MDKSRYEGLTVYIVEDDAAMRDSLLLMLGLLGFRAVSFESAEAFLNTCQDDWAGCIVDTRNAMATVGSANGKVWKA